MAEVRTRDEAIASVDRALQVWAQRLAGVLLQANAVVDGARTQAEQTLRRCAARVASLEHALAAADEESRRRVEAELVRARAANERAHRAAVRSGSGAVAARWAATLPRSPSSGSGIGRCDSV